MPKSDMLDLALNMHQSLVDNVPALVAEINTDYPQYPVVVPVDYLLGVRTEIVQRDLPKLPVLCCGVYMREQQAEGEQEFSQFFMPYVIEVMYGSTDPDALYVQSVKYALLIDLWVERYASNLLKGWKADEAPDIDISYVLQQRSVNKQLIAATGVFVGME